MVWEDYDGDIEEWWLVETGCNISYPTEGYYKAQRKHLKEHPLPFEMHYFCSCDYSMHVLQVPGYSYHASRGDTVVVEPSKMVVNPEAIERFKLACEKYNIPYSEPKWLLCSMWG